MAIFSIHFQIILLLMSCTWSKNNFNKNFEKIYLNEEFNDLKDVKNLHFIGIADCRPLWPYFFVPIKEKILNLFVTRLFLHIWLGWCITKKSLFAFHTSKMWYFIFSSFEYHTINLVQNFYLHMKFYYIFFKEIGSEICKWVNVKCELITDII